MIDEAFCGMPTLTALLTLGWLILQCFLTNRSVIRRMAQSIHENKGLTHIKRSVQMLKITQASPGLYLHSTIIVQTNYS